LRYYLEFREGNPPWQCTMPSSLLRIGLSIAINVAIMAASQVPDLCVVTVPSRGAPVSTKAHIELYKTVAMIQVISLVLLFKLL